MEEQEKGREYKNKERKKKLILRQKKKKKWYHRQWFLWGNYGRTNCPGCWQSIPVFACYFFIPLMVSPPLPAYSLVLTSFSSSVWKNNTKSIWKLMSIYIYVYIYFCPVFDPWGQKKKKSWKGKNFLHSDCPPRKPEAGRKCGERKKRKQKKTK